MCEIVFQLLAEFYYQLLLILKQKYRDTDKSIEGNIYRDKTITKSLSR